MYAQVNLTSFIYSTGSAGLIQSIAALSKGSIVAGVLGCVATAGWTIQGLGNAYYYRQIWQHHGAAGHTLDKVSNVDPNEYYGITLMRCRAGEIGACYAWRCVVFWPGIDSYGHAALLFFFSVYQQPLKIYI